MIKDFLKSFLPPRAKTFDKEIERVLKAIDSLKRENEAIEKSLAKLVAEQTQIQKPVFMEAHEDIVKRQVNIYSAVQEAKAQALRCTRSADEAVWAAIFNNTIVNSTWLKDKAFSPGRWAMGYPALYALYRILNEAHPKRILELGLGQSTRMIGQYASAFDDVEHIVVENNQEWIDFFQNDFQLSPRSHILQLEWGMAPYKEAEAVRVFNGFKGALAGKKFDFICIDAPMGGDMTLYSRIDVLGILPDCLADSFVISLDDCDRTGEARTLNEIADMLSASGIAHVSGRYSGKRDFCVIAADSLKFLCSL